MSLVDRYIIYKYIYIYIYINISIYLCMYIYIHIYICIYMCVCVCVCVCICTAVNRWPIALGARGQLPARDRRTFSYIFILLLLALLTNYYTMLRNVYMPVYVFNVCHFSRIYTNDNLPCTFN